MYIEYLYIIKSLYTHTIYTYIYILYIHIYTIYDTPIQYSEKAGKSCPRGWRVSAVMGAPLRKPSTPLKPAVHHRVHYRIGGFKGPYISPHYAERRQSLGQQM